jgi:hypothetical protein
MTYSKHSDALNPKEKALYRKRALTFKAGRN